MRKYFAHLISLATLISPISLFAQSGSPTAQRLIQSGITVLNLLVSFAIGLALVLFLFAIVKYVTASEGEDKAKARGLMIYGIIGLFVSVSVWGLVQFIQNALGLTGEETISAPNLPTF